MRIRKVAARPRTVINGSGTRNVHRTHQSAPNRESRLADVAGHLRPAFAQLGAHLPKRLRIAIGFRLDLAELGGVMALSPQQWPASWSMPGSASKPAGERSIARVLSSA